MVIYFPVLPIYFSLQPSSNDLSTPITIHLSLSIPRISHLSKLSQLRLFTAFLLPSSNVFMFFTIYSIFSPFFYQLSSSTVFSTYLPYWHTFTHDGSAACRFPWAGTCVGRPSALPGSFSSSMGLIPLALLCPGSVLTGRPLVGTRGVATTMFQD